jgi:aminoglycoside/choline kinase family phosphotransferase
MDAPPDREPLDRFLGVAQLLDAAGVRVPGRLSVNEAEGYLLLEDFGNHTYLPLLKTESANGLYRDAWSALIKIQSWSLLQTPQDLNLPQYDKEKLTQEMSLFEAWYVEKHLGARLNDKEKKMLAEILEGVCSKALAQTQVLVHRDYHSRNLMKLESGSPGILDFQDAVVGPITYDLVSLLRDAYVRIGGELSVPIVGIATGGDAQLGGGQGDEGAGTAG